MEMLSRVSHWCSEHGCLWLPKWECVITWRSQAEAGAWNVEMKTIVKLLPRNKTECSQRHTQQSLRPLGSSETLQAFAKLDLCIQGLSPRGPWLILVPLSVGYFRMRKKKKTFWIGRYYFRPVPANSCIILTSYVEPQCPCLELGASSWTQCLSTS